MATYTKKKNLIKSRDEYSRYYGDFRGVDFSSDHTQVHDQRLAYSVNMFKDYQSGEGQAIETIPGFRKRAIIPKKQVNDGGVIMSVPRKIRGIHRYDHVVDGKRDAKILVHAGEDLYLWDEYPLSANVPQNMSIILPEKNSAGNYVINFENEGVSVVKVDTVVKADGTILVTGWSFADGNLIIDGNELSFLTVGESLAITYEESEVVRINGNITLNDAESTSFLFNNKMYIIDGKNYLVYDGESLKSVIGDDTLVYIPTTYRNIIVGGENRDAGYEYEQRNILSDMFKNTFISDGETARYYLSEGSLDKIERVVAYGKTLTAGEDYTVNLADGYVEFLEDKIPTKPESTLRGETETDGYYTRDYAGIEILARKKWDSWSGVVSNTSSIEDCISKCTIATIFDKRVFLSGNPNLPNHIFFCGINNTTGYEDATYFGVLDFLQDGVEPAPITGMIAVADTLAVLKNHAKQDGSVYFHTHYDTGHDVAPVTYPASQGLSGIGCLGACVNFLDDPIFISRLGVEGIGQLSVRLERAVEHRSSLIDSKLVNLNLESAKLAEWDGYLLVLVDGKIFMADSRQRYTHSTGVPQYEWYYIEGIGVYDGQYKEYYYSPGLFAELNEKTILHKTDSGEEKEYELVIATNVYDEVSQKAVDLTNTVAKPPSVSFDESPVIHYYEWIDEYGIKYGAYYQLLDVMDTDGTISEKAVLCVDRGSHTGGTFSPGIVITNMDDNIFFGTDNGTVCSFNFDKRNETDGMISPKWYSFDDRTIYCGCATKMDNCGIPHLTKSTVKKSTVIKTKSMISSAAKFKVRTNKKAYEQVGRFNSVMFSFDDVDFSDFSFVSADQNLFTVKEKEKHWVEKQYFVYSDEFRKPFSLHYIAFRYMVAGRFKE